MERIIILILFFFSGDFSFNILWNLVLPQKGVACGNKGTETEPTLPNLGVPFP